VGVGVEVGWVRIGRGGGALAVGWVADMIALRCVALGLG
jgi:hypothetical protein